RDKADRSLDVSWGRVSGSATAAPSSSWCAHGQRFGERCPIVPIKSRNSQDLAAATVDMMDKMLALPANPQFRRAWHTSIFGAGGLIERVFAAVERSA